MGFGGRGSINAFMPGSEGLGVVHKPVVESTKVLVPKEYVAPEHGTNSPEYIAKQKALANAEQVSRDKGVVWKDAPARVKNNGTGKLVPNTVLGDSDYVKSLKIGTGEAGIARYNELLGRKAFHPGNPEMKKIAKQLGIKNPSGRKPNRDPEVVHAEHVANAKKVLGIDESAPLSMAPDRLNAAEQVTLMANGSMRHMPGYYTPIYTSPDEVAAQNRVEANVLKYGMV